MTTLRFAPAHRGGLLVDAPHEYRCASLRLCAEGLGVASAHSDEVLLPWSARGPVGVVGETKCNRWIIDSWSVNGDPRGIALRVEGDHADACEPIWRATCVGFRRVHAAFELTVAGRAIPILADRWTVGPPRVKERGTLAALTHVLARRADLRSRLPDSERMARLAADIMEGMLRDPDLPEPMMRDASDIVFALRACGFRHEFGRPLSYTELRDLAEVVARTRERLGHNPYRVDTEVPSDDEIKKWARRMYYDVKPWPFSALVDE